MKYGLKLLGWSALTLIILEGLVRVWWCVLPTTYVIDPVRGQLPAKGSVTIWRLEGNGITHYIEDGEIATPYTEGPSAVVLGDSFAEALQVNDDQKFVWQAEAQLAENGFKVNLRNLAASGLSIADYIYLEPYLKNHYAPRFVVITLNDLDYDESFSSSKSHYFGLQNNTLILHNGASFSSRLKEDPLKNLIRYSSLFRYTSEKFEGNIIGQLKNLFTPNTAAQPEILTPAALSGIEDSDRMEKEIELIAKTFHDYQLIVILLPDVPKILDGKLNCADQSHDNQIAIFKKYPDIKIIDPKQRFCGLAGQGELPYGFANSVLGEGHLNAAGHAILGEMLAQEIESISTTMLDANP